MRVLLLFPAADGQTGSAINYAFRKLGHRVICVDAKTHPDFSSSSAYHFNPDLVFCSRTYQLTDEVEKIKKRFKDATICMWNVDSKINIYGWERLFPLVRLVDYYFVVEMTKIPEWKKINSNTYWLPQGVQNEVYNKPKEITDADKEKYACDISFAGRARSWRKPFLNAVNGMNIDFKRWGLSRRSKIINEEHNKMVSMSKINLGCSGPGAIELKGNISVRDYKIMGAGGFLLEFYKESLKDIFPLGTMATYTNPLNLIASIEYWLEHEKERKEIAERGYKWVHTNATYTHRIKMALDYMGVNS